MLVEDVLHCVVIADVAEPSVEALKHDDVDGIRLHVLKEPLQAFAAAERLACRRTLIGI